MYLTERKRQRDRMLEEGFEGCVGVSWMHVEESQSSSKGPCQELKSSGRYRVPRDHRCCKEPREGTRGNLPSIRCMICGRPRHRVLVMSPRSHSWRSYSWDMVWSSVPTLSCLYSCLWANLVLVPTWTGVSKPGAGGAIDVQGPCCFFHSSALMSRAERLWLLSPPLRSQCRWLRKGFVNVSCWLLLLPC